MENIPVEFCFRGKRDYVHGNTLYTTIIEQMAALANGTDNGHDATHDLTDIDMKFRHFAAHNAEIVLVDQITPERLAQSFAQFSVRAGAKTVNGILVERAEPVACREPYDEEPIRAACQLDLEEKSVTLASDLPAYTPIDVVVAMTKMLHEAIVPGERWVFAGIKLARPLATSDIDSLTIEIRRQLGKRYTESALTTATDTLGFIHFSVVPA